MYISPRAAVVRNLSVSVVNGAITLVILLIAPLGLAAVIINTLLITVATYLTATVADRVVRFLNPSVQEAEILPGNRPSQIRSNNTDNLDIY